MPVDSSTTTNIVCDNPACPGNDLDPTSRYGWLFISSEVYGEPTQTSVFCSYGCLGTAGQARHEDPSSDPFAAPASDALPGPTPPA